MAEVHSRAARSARADLVGLASSTLDSAFTAATRLGVARAYGSAEELIAADDIDVIHICSPNATHAAYASAALAAGKHVICEKPLATSGDDAQVLADLATSTGLTATPFVYRPMVRDRPASPVTSALSLRGRICRTGC